MNLKISKRSHIIQLIIMLIGLILVIISEELTNWLQNYINYKSLLIITVIFSLIEYTYILLYKNHIDDLEEKLRNVPDLSNKAPNHEFQSKNNLIIEKEIKNKLLSLGQKEKDYLNRFITEDVKTLKFDYDDPIADGLRAQGIIKNTSTIGTWRTFSYTIADTYWNYIKKHPKIIK